MSGWSPKSVLFRKPHSGRTSCQEQLEGEGECDECPSHPLCRVEPIVFHQSRAPVYSTSLNDVDPCTRCLSQPTTSPHCLALTLSRSTRPHTVSLYLVLTLSHVRFRISCHMVSPSVNVSHRLALIRIGEIPSDWYETLISYIHRNKGKL